MISSLLLVVLTLIKGFKVDENPLFIFAECILNILILTDFIFRVKIMGVKRFFQGDKWNIFDAVVVSGCILLFILMLLSRSGTI
jgi:hypothetical protein